MLHAEFTSAALNSLPSQKPVASSLERPLIKFSLATRVYQHILEAILSGTLSSGGELNEVALAKQLNVSRTPVHEALRSLASDGLVEILPSGKSQVVAFTRDSIVSLYDMRKILEGAACSLAARLMSEESLRDLRHKADLLKPAPLDSHWPTKAINFDLVFHDTIAEGSRNEFLRKDILRHRRLVQGFCRFTGTPKILRIAFEEHFAILERLEARDADGARHAMIAHIDARMRTLMRLLEEHAPASESVSLNPA